MRKVEKYIFSNEHFFYFIPHSKTTKVRSGDFKFRKALMQRKYLGRRRMERRGKHAFAPSMKIGYKTLLGHCCPDIIH